MNLNKILRVIFIAVIIATVARAQQFDPMLYQRWNIMDINKVKTQFNNTMLLCDGNEQNFPLARPPAFEYPNGSGNSYGTSVAIVIGAPADQDTGAVGGTNVDKKAYLDGSMDEGSAAFWDEEHFAPYPSMVGGSKAPLSTDPSTWPKGGPNNGWPSLIPGTDQPMPVGSEGWPGMGKNGERVADQETYTVTYAWGGPLDPGTDNKDNRNLRTTVEMRGLAWTGELYQDFIIWVFVVRNHGTAPIKDMRVGVHSDFGFLPIFQSLTHTGDDDRHYYDPKLQMAWGMDDNGYEISPAGNTLLADQIAKAGTIALRMPGASKKVKTYDAVHFWMDATTPIGNGADKAIYFRYNLSNQDDPRDSDHDGIDDDFDRNGVPDNQDGGPGYYLASGADGFQVMGSEPFTLQPGQADTMIIATVFGMTEKQLFKNATNALTLYKSNWQVVKAPAAPRVEIVPSDGKNTIYFSTESERERKFEGYKIYRSEDNGVNWGASTFTDFGGTIHYNPLKQYDKIDTIKGNYRSIPEFAWYFLGDDAGLPALKVIDNEQTKYFKKGDTVRVYVDDQITNGLSYRYYVAAYDTGNGITGPMENTAGQQPLAGTNTVQVVPHAAMSVGSLANVKVVPNPYVVANGWEQTRDNQLQFTHLPERATIRIYNAAGEMVLTINHDASGAIAPSIAIWDLKNESQQMVAAGLYFYHLESPAGTAQGKFIIIL